MTTFLCLTTLLFAQLRDPVLSFRASAEQEREVVAKLPGDLAAKLPKGRLTQEQGQNVLRVALVDDDTEQACAAARRSSSSSPSWTTRARSSSIPGCSMKSGTTPRAA